MSHDPVCLGTEAQGNTGAKTLEVSQVIRMGPVREGEREGRGREEEERDLARQVSVSGVLSSG